MYMMAPDVEFDPSKARINLRKHGVGFAEAATSLADPLAITVADESGSELRWVSFGISDSGRLLAVCYTMRSETPRLISARKATSREKSAYARRI